MTLTKVCILELTLDGMDQSEVQGKSDYFLSSSNDIHFFLESSAVDESTNGIKEGCDKLLLLNKVEHGLHLVDPVFKEYSFSRKVKELVQALRYKDPVLPQSMYILKNAKVVGESHQDSSFLYATPRLACLYLWLALDDGAEENGCYFNNNQNLLFVADVKQEQVRVRI